MLTATVSSDRLLVWCVAVCVLCMKDFDLTMPRSLIAVSWLQVTVNGSAAKLTQSPFAMRLQTASEVAAPA